MPRRDSYEHEVDEEHDDPEDPDESDQDEDDEPALLACPYCGCEISEEAGQCPHCRNYLSAEDAPWRVPMWIVIAAVLGLLCTILWIVAGRA
jgi:hypothetical protein